MYRKSQLNRGPWTLHSDPAPVIGESPIALFPGRG